MKKLTEKQKARLYQLRRSENFTESLRLDDFPSARESAAQRAGTLELGPPAMGLPRLCVIHRHLFLGIHDGAGQLRTVDIVRGDMCFCHFDYLEKEGSAVMQQLESENYLRGLPKGEIISRLAHYYTEINMLHPFFAGNGLAQRVFFEQLMIHAGYDPRWRPIQRDEWQAALRAGAVGALAPLTTLFARVVNEPDGPV
ncbi:putative adenosine monophosphate-protein transferase Fic [Martelella alba]|uniref:protein adenylyltransferase n=1 Tax=Martelella alba TaxID=2590451 RepID=A0ABY2SI10_9HYPH|nr:putative adenosine monophosphate-protein transferase Fic [Martelella alba]TKI04996.1 putative adenosine monophosphate-protein transferase Fic [Martelella alba]